MLYTAPPTNSCASSLTKIKGTPFWKIIPESSALATPSCCFSGQVSRGSGDIAVQMTCIGCENVRVHVESEDSGDNGVTVEIVSVSRLETTVSLRLSIVLARLRALTSRDDSFLREAPSFMRL